MRMLFTGSRHCNDFELIKNAVLTYLESKEWGCAKLDSAVFVHGGAAGADSLVSALAAELDVTENIYAADWDKHGRAAGPIRNQDMVNSRPEVCFAFPGPQSSGTWDCIRRAVKAGIPTFIYPSAK